MLGFDAEGVVVDVDLQLVRTEVVGVQADLEGLVVVLDLEVNLK